MVTFLVRNKVLFFKFHEGAASINYFLNKEDCFIQAFKLLYASRRTCYQLILKLVYRETRFFCRKRKLWDIHPDLYKVTLSYFFIWKYLLSRYIWLYMVWIELNNVILYCLPTGMESVMKLDYLTRLWCLTVNL